MSTHGEINRERHASRRQVLNHAFSDSATRSAEGFVIENIRTWCKRLGEGSKPGEWTPEKSMSDWCTYVAYGDLASGKRLNVMENDEHRFVPAAMMNGMKLMYPVKPHPSLSPKKNPTTFVTDN